MVVGYWVELSVNVIKISFLQETNVINTKCRFLLALCLKCKIQTDSLVFS